MWLVATMWDGTVLAGQPLFLKGGSSLINPVFVTFPPPAPMADFCPPGGLSWCRQREEGLFLSCILPLLFAKPPPAEGHAGMEECGSAALELNDDPGPLECPQSPTPSASPVSLLRWGNRWPQLSPAGPEHIVTPS